MRYGYDDGYGLLVVGINGMPKQTIPLRKPMKTSPVEASLAYVHYTRHVFPPGRVLKVAIQNNISRMPGRIQNVELH